VAKTAYLSSGWTVPLATAPIMLRAHGGGLADIWKNAAGGVLREIVPKSKADVIPLQATDERLLCAFPGDAPKAVAPSLAKYTMTYSRIQARREITADSPLPTRVISCTIRLAAGQMRYATAC